MRKFGNICSFYRPSRLMFLGAKTLVSSSDRRKVLGPVLRNFHESSFTQDATAMLHSCDQSDSRFALLSVAIAWPCFHMRMRRRTIQHWGFGYKGRLQSPTALLYVTGPYGRVQYTFDPPSRHSCRTRSPLLWWNSRRDTARFMEVTNGPAQGHLIDFRYTRSMRKRPLDPRKRCISTTKDLNASLSTMH